jgi:homoserine kinase
MRLRVTVPASVGNCGPAFDSFGLATGLHNEILVDTGRPGPIEIEGEGVDNLASGESNLVSLAMERFSLETGRKVPPHSIRLINRIPFSRGLGSSAAAIVGGLAAADAMTGTDLPPEELLRLALMLEDHPDNVSAAIHGGAVLTVFEDRVGDPFTVLPLRVPRTWRAVVHIPERESHTEEARALLPDQVPRSCAIFNHSRVGLLISAILQDQPKRLRVAMQDRLHQPYRAALFPEMTELMKAAMGAGAWGACLSGAGPAILALSPQDRAGEVAAAMEACGGDGRSVNLPIPDTGVHVEVEES